MSNGSAGDASRREELSALADGELDATAVARACAAWRTEPELRVAWHAYHLVGDVLRSDDLAVAPARDEAFLQSLRTRLAAEPVVLAPEPVAQALPAAPAGRAAAGARGGRWAWMAPSAVAAGFVLVAGALVVTRTPPPVAPPVTLAQQQPAPAAAPAATLAAAPALPPVQLPATALVETPRLAPRAPRLLRDAQLDRYLAAHQQFAGSAALGMPSGFLRNAAAEAPSR